MKTQLTAVAVLVLTAICFSNSAAADPKDYFYQRFLQKKNAHVKPFLPNSTSGILKQKIDHQNPDDQRSFDQRYYLNSYEAEGPDSPVILYICGEATCRSSDMQSVADHARALKAHLISLEHRYYGESQPFPELSTENMKFLSTAQALSDLAAFHDFGRDQLGLKGKWIAVGGSYAGSLAAFVRLKYPERFAGALSSSGPVRAKADFEEYDFKVSTVVPPTCASRMRSAVKTVEESLSESVKVDAYKKLFGAEDVKDNIDFMYILADMGALAVQYGYRDQFCRELLGNPDPVEGYANAGKKMFELFGITPIEDSFQSAESTDPNAYLGTFGMRQWMYQSCTEYGYYQIAYHDPAVSVRSSLIDLDYHDQVCKRLFGLQKTVDTKATNENFYLPLLNPSLPGASKIFMTNGSTDPWSLLSMTTELGNGIANPNLTLMTIEGGAHCDDLSWSSTQGIAQAKALFQELAKNWLD